MTRNLLFTIINITGLAIGMGLFFILWNYSNAQLESDQFHDNWKNKFRFGTLISWTDDKVNWDEAKWGIAHPELASDVLHAYPEIKNLTRIQYQKNFNFDAGIHKKHATEIALSNGDKDGQRKNFREEHVAYAEPNLFQFFSIPLIKGNSSHALAEANSVVISQMIALKYFGTENALGETMVLNDSINLNVNGVFEDLPANTHLDLEIIISASTVFPTLDDERLVGFHCYFELQDNTNYKVLNDRINTDLKKEIKTAFFGDWPYGSATIYLQPVSKMSFEAYRWDHYSLKSVFILNIFKYASLIIVLLAWINYLNLNVSSVRRRIKELATRKTVGGGLVDFAIQFGIESVLITGISLIAAMTLIQLVSNTIQVSFNIDVIPWKNIPVSAWLVLLTICLSGVILTTWYPCHIVLKSLPSKLISGLKTQKAAGHNSVYGSLVVFQYATAIVMLTVVVTLVSQINYILNKDVGFVKSKVVVIDLPPISAGTQQSALNTFRDKLNNLTEINGVTISQSVPSDHSEGALALVRNLNDAGLRVASNGGVDEHFIPFFGIKLLAGRNFSHDQADSTSIILSEATARRLGFTSNDDAVGSPIYAAANVKVNVIGVMKDYEMTPALAGTVKQVGLGLTYKHYLNTLPSRKISIHVESSNVSETMAGIENIFQQLFSDAIFNWYLLDEVVARQYQSDQIARNQVTMFATVAMFIASLGLLGMISNKVIEKSKEVGIRRVFGASMIGITLVLLRSTIMHVLIAIAVALPTGYYIVSQYLERFTDRITLTWWYFTLPVAILIAAMAIVLSSVLIRTARNQPLDAIRND